MSRFASAGKDGIVTGVNGPGKEKSLQAALSVFLVTLGLGQLLSTVLRLRAASLVGPNWPAGYILGSGLVLAGALFLLPTWAALFWAIPAGPLALVILLLTGSLVAPPPHPNGFFAPNNPAHGGCWPVEIPDGEYRMPGLLLVPPTDEGARGNIGPGKAAVCVIPGAGDTKTSFKWRLVQALLAEGLTVLTIDPPGHGDYRHRPIVFPDCLSAIPAAVRFLRQQSGLSRVGVVGISLGGALAARSLAERGSAASETPGPALAANVCRVEALVMLETPVRLKLNRRLVYREFWCTISRAPVLSLLGEMSIKQVWESWHTGGYRSPHRSTAELIDLLDPPASLARLSETPILLVYSRSDPIAPPAAAQAVRQAAPGAAFIEVKKASHVTLTLIPEVNQSVARWIKETLQEEREASPKGRLNDEQFG